MFDSVNSVPTTIFLSSHACHMSTLVIACVHTGTVNGSSSILSYCKAKKLSLL